MVDSCIICAKKSLLHVITTLNANQLYSAINVVTLKLKCNWLQSLEKRYETFYAAPPHHSFHSLPCSKEDIEVQIHENCICVHTCIYVINHNGYFKRKKLSRFQRRSHKAQPWKFLQNLYTGWFYDHYVSMMKDIALYLKSQDSA